MKGENRRGQARSPTTSGPTCLYAGWKHGSREEGKIKSKIGVRGSQYLPKPGASGGNIETTVLLNLRSETPSPSPKGGEKLP